MNIDHFFPNDLKEAINEYNCMQHCLEKAELHFKKGNFVESSAYYVNAARSLEVLNDLKQKKIEQDIQIIKKRMNAQLFVDKQIFELRGKAYEKSK